MTDMTKTIRHMVLAMGAGLMGAGFAPMTLAQDSTNQVAVKTDWSVFTEDNPKECWGVSAPRETVNTRDGQVVSVQRSEIRLFVTYRPGQPTPEISFTGGYPFKGGSTVKVEIDGANFDLFSDGEWAWPAAGTDDQLLKAMKNGSNAKFTAFSGKGTKTEDTFSLRGFTAAVEDAAGRCK